MGSGSRCVMGDFMRSLIESRSQSWVSGKYADVETAELVEGVSREQLHFEPEVGTPAALVGLKEAVRVHDSEAVESALFGEDRVDELVEGVAPLAEEHGLEVREDIEDVVLLEEQSDDRFAGERGLHLGHAVDPDVHHRVDGRVEDFEA